jgi:hypothetical protein
MEHARAVATGIPNEVYDLILLVQQAAEDVVRYEAFAADAEAAGDAELATWFRELADSDRDIARKGTGLLRTRLDRVALPDGEPG